MNLADLNESKVGEVLTYLSRTDEEFAVAKCNLESAQILQKRVRARLFLSADGSVAERNAEAEISDEAQAADDAYISAKLVFEKIKAHRERGELMIDVFRTLEASRRRV
jgi:hypothetical protein